MCLFAQKYMIFWCATVFVHLFGHLFSLNVKHFNVPCQNVIFLSSAVLTLHATTVEQVDMWFTTSGIRGLSPITASWILNKHPKICFHISYFLNWHDIPSFMCKTLVFLLVLWWFWQMIRNYGKTYCLYFSLLWLIFLSKYEHRYK